MVKCLSRDPETGVLCMLLGHEGAHVTHIRWVDELTTDDHREWLYKACLKNADDEEWHTSDEGFTSIDTAIKDLFERLEGWGFISEGGNKVVVKKFLKPTEIEVELTDEQNEKFAKRLQ